MTENPILRAGSTDPALTELQEHLLRLGLLRRHTPGAYCPETERAVRALQIMRGLRVDGITGPQTWAAFQESGHTLGDRLLSVRSPYLRGDDVLELQLRLDRLGFRVGRVDGILGPDTAAAIREFQRNSGIAVDAICGPDTLASINRFQHLAGGRISEISELEEFHTCAEHGVRVCIALPPVISETVLDRIDLGRHAIVNHVGIDSDYAGDHDVALAANKQADETDLFLGLRQADVETSTLAYFELGDARSAVGRALAEAVQYLLPVVEIQGMSGPLLRETRMPALLLEYPTGAPLEAQVLILNGIFAAIDESFRSPTPSN